MTSQDPNSPNDAEHPYTRAEIDDAIEAFIDNDKYVERARKFREFDRWTGDNPVLLVVDAAATVTGQNYFNQAKPQAEAFHDQYVKTGKITTLAELADAETSLQEIFTNQRKTRVAREIAAHLTSLSAETDLKALQTWAENANSLNHQSDPIGSINGVGLRTFQYLRMLAGTDAIKPDIQVLKFVDALQESLPEAPLETSTDTHTLTSCQWLAKNSSFELIELDQIAWWFYADVPDEVRNSMSNDGLRVIIKSVDRTEFEAIRWGEIQNGKIIRTYDRAEELFYPFEGFVEQLRDRSYRGTGDLSDEVFWLRECRSYGSQAQREKAGVHHPAIDRELQYPQGPLVGALRGLDADGSAYEDVLELDLTEPFLERSPSRDGHTVTLRYEMVRPETTDEPTPTGDQFDDQALPTAVNIIEEIVKATEFEHRIDGVDINTIEIIGYLYTQTVWTLRIDYDTAASIDWNTYEPHRLKTDAEQYVNLGH